MTDSLTTGKPEPFETQPSHAPLNVLQLMWRRRSLLVLGVVIACVIGAVYYAQITPIYQSSAQVLVMKKTPESLSAAGGEGISASTEDYLSTHQTLIRSPVIVGDAVRQANLDHLPSLAEYGDATSGIIAALKVSREMNGNNPTSILNISFRSPHAKDTAAVVTAIIESYQRFLRNRYKSVADETAKLIAQANDILEKKLTAKQKEYNEFIIRQPAFWRGKDGVSTIQERILSLEAKRSALLLLEAEVQGRIAALERAMKEGRYSRAELLAMVTQTFRRSGGEGMTPAVTMEERLMTLELQDKTLSEDYGPDHPEVRLVRDQLTMLRSRMRRIDEDSATEESAQTNPVKIRLQMLKLELENTRMAAKALSDLLQEEYRRAEPLRGFEKKDESYRMEIAHSQQLFDAVSKRLDEVSILKDFSGGYEAETIFPASVGRKVHPRLLAVLAPALFAGILLGFGLAYLAELSDQSFRTPEEVRRHLGLPVVGHIPFFRASAEEDRAADGSQLAPSLCTVYQPRSPEAEAYRAVRTALYFNSREDGHTVVQVTSPDMGDGKSTLIANLGVSIAQSNKKVIVIDADLRRPRLHKLFNLSPKHGLTSVICGEAEVEDVLQPMPVPGLFILPCGPIPPNPAELLTLPRFKELLAYIREKFDFVLIDTPPLLAVTDPCVVIPHVDGVILTVRISKKARPHASRAKEILSTLRARVMGVVVNGVRPDGEGYGYGGYHDSNYQDDPPLSETNGEGAELENDTVRTVEKKRTGSHRSSGKKTRFLAWLFK